MDNFLLLPRFLATMVSDGAFAIAFGSVVASFWITGENLALRDRMRVVAISSLIALLFAVGAQMFLQAATMIGSADTTSVRSQVSDVLTGTHAGRALLSQFCFLFLPLILLLTRFDRHTRAEGWSALALLLVLAGIRSATGHAAGDGDFTLPELFQLIHLASTAIWSGCVIVAGLVVLPVSLKSQRTDETVTFMRTLSRTVTIALLLIVLSGVYNSYRGLGGQLAPLTGTQWGKLLDLKLVLIVAALTLGVLNRRLIRGDCPLSLQECTRLAAIVRVEAVVMLLILTVSAWLANSPPPNSL